MDPAVLLFLSSGLFLGWSLGANDAANVFGTAVGTRMVRFTTAAIICGVFVVLGAMISGAGPAHTLGKLGSINALPGAFMAALSAALTVYLMTKAGLPVSTTQAIVGAIVGWNLFSGSLTDTATLVTLILTWVICPVLAAVIAAGLYKAITAGLRKAKLHLLRLDAYTRAALMLAGAFGAYSLGANNIANVMGVFVPVSPFTAFSLGGGVTVSPVQQLFLLGAIAIAVGVFTYSKGVMMTIGRDLATLSPIAAFVVVLAHSIVLFLFASQGLEHLLARAGLPTIPLVPVSSSQAVVGAIIGIGLLKGGAGIRGRLLGGIALSWLATPAIAGLVCFIALFFLQNVFSQQVYRPVVYELSEAVLERIESEGIDVSSVRDLTGTLLVSTPRLRAALEERVDLTGAELRAFVGFAEIDRIEIDKSKLSRLGADLLITDGQRAALARLAGRSFNHRWMLDDALARASDEWKARPATTVNKLFNRRLDEKRRAIHTLFRVE
ncbi:MAG: inorganic phosphate transporter [Proteobacteria bacterium]|nr:inorganic phosphate transporter [Pseudomonadota bacterium]